MKVLRDACQTCPWLRSMQDPKGTIIRGTLIEPAHREAMWSDRSTRRNSRGKLLVNRGGSYLLGMPPASGDADRAGRKGYDQVCHAADHTFDPSIKLAKARICSSLRVLQERELLRAHAEGSGYNFRGRERLTQEGMRRVLKRMLGEVPAEVEPLVMAGQLKVIPLDQLLAAASPALLDDRIVHHQLEPLTPEERIAWSRPE